MRVNDEMVDHRFLSDDRLVLETGFREGTGVVVNFGVAPSSDPRGSTVPPEGYRVVE